MIGYRNHCFTPLVAFTFVLVAVLYPLQRAYGCPKCRLGAKALVGKMDDLTLLEDFTESPEKPATGDDTSLHAAEGIDDGLRTAHETNGNRGASTYLTITSGIDIVSAYYYRGIRQEDVGLIAQPNVTVGLTVYRREDVTVTPYVGTFNSFHSEQTHAEGGYDSWYESEVFAGVLTEAGPFALDVKYSIHLYPNGGLDQIQEVAAKLSYDFASLWRPKGAPADFVLNGWIYFVRETQDANAFPDPVPARDGGIVFVSRGVGHYLPPPPVIGQKRGFDPTGEDTYIEVGLEPSMRVEAGGRSIGLAFPVILGLSADSYYGDADGHNAPFGYVSTSAKITIPLGVPEKFGHWYVNASVTWLHLFADTIITANQGDRDEGIAGIGLSVGF